MAYSAQSTDTRFHSGIQPAGPPPVESSAVAEANAELEQRVGPAWHLAIAVLVEQRDAALNQMAQLAGHGSRADASTEAEHQRLVGSILKLHQEELDALTLELDETRATLLRERQRSATPLAEERAAAAAPPPRRVATGAEEDLFGEFIASQESAEVASLRHRIDDLERGSLRLQRELDEQQALLRERDEAAVQSALREQELRDELEVLSPGRSTVPGLLPPSEAEWEAQSRALETQVEAAVSEAEATREDAIRLQGERDDALRAADDVRLQLHGELDSARDELLEVQSQVDELHRLLEDARDHARDQEYALREELAELRGQLERVGEEGDHAASLSAVPALGGSSEE